MTTRVLRSAAAKVQDTNSVYTRCANCCDESDQHTPLSRRFRRAPNTMASRDSPSSSEEDSHLSVTVKVPSTKLRQATQVRRAGQFEGGEIVHGKRNRGGRKSYIVDSSPDDDDEQEEEEEEEEEDLDGEEDENEDDDDDDDDEDDDDDDDDDDDQEDEEVGEMEVDAEGEDVDAEGEEDAEGDVDMDMPRSAAVPQVIKVSRPTNVKPILKGTASKTSQDDVDVDDDDDDDDDELSEPAESDLEDTTMGYGDDTMADEDAEGEEIEVAKDEQDDDDEEEEEEEEEDEEEEEEEEEEEQEEEEVEEEEEDEEEEEEDRRKAEAERKKAEKEKRKRSAALLDQRASDEEMESDDVSRDETPDLAKMTKRQRARFEDAPQEYMKLSDEIQVKKVFTAEELSMRRQEMARRRRNLSEKRTEEVKMETINKLLKKQAPKINRKAAAAATITTARTENSDTEAIKPDSIFIRWVSNKNGSQVSVPVEILDGPVGKVFGGNLIKEVA